jgi:hypothetical protein
MDAVVRHIGCGESRHGRRVSPCPSKSVLFREAAGHPVSHKELPRLPLIVNRPVAAPFEGPPGEVVTLCRRAWRVHPSQLR